MYMKGLLRHKHDIIMQEPLEAHVEIPTNTKKLVKISPPQGPTLNKNICFGSNKRGFDRQHCRLYTNKLEVDQHKRGLHPQWAFHR